MPTPLDASRRQQGTDIRAITGVEAVRLRSGMYVGTPPEAIYNMFHAIFDNAIEEAMNGSCTRIEVTIHPDSSIMVSDNGIGIPVDKHPIEDLSELEVAFTMLSARRPFTGRYRVSGGMHGIGFWAVNALSEWLVVEVRRDGYVWRQSYARGVCGSDLVQVRAMNHGESTGTTIAFLPDAEIFNEVRKKYNFEFEVIANRCNQVAYLVHGLTIHLVDQRQTISPREMTYFFPGGLKEFAEYLNRGYTPLHPVIAGRNLLQLYDTEHNQFEIEVEFAFQYTEDMHTTERLFVNTIETLDGGTHQTGLRTALTRTINEWVRNKAYLKDTTNRFTGRHTLKGLTAVVSLKHPRPYFETATKLKLLNPEVNGIIASSISIAFGECLKGYGNYPRNILDHFKRIANQ